MTRAELIENLAKKHDLTKVAAADVVSDIFDTITKAVKKTGRFSYQGFGTFTLKKRKARKGRNPHTGESIKIKASKTVGFKPSKNLKDRL